MIITLRPRLKVKERLARKDPGVCQAAAAGELMMQLYNYLIEDDAEGD